MPTIQAAADTCPCDVNVALRRGSEYSPQSTALARLQTFSGWWTGSATVTWLFEVPSGTTQTIQLMTPAIAYTGDDESSFATGAITAIYVPFGPDGGSTLPEAAGTERAPAMVTAP